MTTRRDFLKHAAMLAGTTGLANFLPPSILRAMALDPKVGSTYLDAEHVVILMQENRSFDHSYGSLNGVRGFNDPRFMIQPNGNPVWLQTNKEGQTYSPFRLDIHRTKSTWMGDVPHARHTQVDAFNNGNYNNWLEAKRVSNPKYRAMPLTLGYYTREDIPFYYALADAFTICDQNFAAAMTSTHPNRLFHWTGTIREKQAFGVKANIRNTDSATEKHTWKTFPERLEENDISWKFYQNDLTAGGGLAGEERSWLTNFGCNPLEWFKNYKVKFFDRYLAGLSKQASDLPGEITALEQSLKTASEADLKKIKAEITTKQKVLASARHELETYSSDKFNSLPQHAKNLHQRGFATNKEDADFRSITTFSYSENGEQATATMPKSDILYQFRKDVNEGKLPAVSWLTAPQKFSDHPSAPWYGAWMISEILDILTQKPEVWKKTIFILNYDENDGYFDHQAPFIAPYPGKPATGRCSGGIDTGVEHITREEELAFGEKPNEARSGPVGLGYRVPMIIASPWSRGGKVCSQVFEHTSVLMFLEHFFSKRTGKKIIETNISPWRRTISGNLTSAFAPFNQEETRLPFIDQKEYLEKINKAKSAPEPNNFKSLTPEELAEIRDLRHRSKLLPRQEEGSRKSCALPYELSADGYVENGLFKLVLAAGNKRFGEQSAGAPFKVFIHAEKEAIAFGDGCIRDYALAAGTTITDEWKLSDYSAGPLSIRVHGPNGFFREFVISGNSPAVKCALKQTQGYGMELTTADPHSQMKAVRLDHNNYGYKSDSISLTNGSGKKTIDLSSSRGWYDFTITAGDYKAHYAGRIETGEDSISDPLLG